MWLFFGFLFLFVCVGMYVIDGFFKMIKNIINREKVTHEQIKCGAIIVIIVYSLFILL